MLLDMTRLKLTRHKASLILMAWGVELRLCLSNHTAAPKPNESISKTCLNPEYPTILGILIMISLYKA